MSIIGKSSKKNKLMTTTKKQASKNFEKPTKIGKNNGQENVKYFIV